MKKTSKNSGGKGGNKWLHPDIVGLEDSSSRWLSTVRDCAKHAFSEHIFLRSFEVKTKLNRANLHRAFFQTASNSSWAHYGYLAATEINKNCEQELRLLANAHNISVILLNTENPAESQILLETDGDKDIDWDMVSRIAEENRDFEEYLQLVKDAYQGTALKRQKGWYPVKT